MDQAKRDSGAGQCPVAPHPASGSLSGERAGARRVLVVDDSKMQRRILAVTLAKWGYSVEEAGSADQAIDICRRAPPDIVISDWMMPGMSGPDFCKVFRGMARDTYGYFILLTSKADKVDVAEGLISGADDFLTKPVNSGELRARLTAGDRVHRMHWELTRKNRLIADTLHELQQLYDSIDSDLIEAKKLQQSLVREREVRIGPARISQLLRTAGRVGGDLVGFYPAGPDRVAVFSLDVSGHGISSALMTARLAGFLSSSVPQQNIGLGPDGTALRPDRIAARLNEIALREFDGGHYFTLALADLDLRDGHLRMVQAGHPHPLIQRAEGRIDMLGQGGFPVGLIDDARFEMIEARLNPGDRLILASDGVTECADPQGTLLGDDGFIRMLDTLAEVPGRRLLETIAWKLADRTAEDRFEDDVSAISLEYLRPG